MSEAAIKKWTGLTTGAHLILREMLAYEAHPQAPKASLYRLPIRLGTPGDWARLFQDGAILLETGPGIHKGRLTAWGRELARVPDIGREAKA